MSKIWNRELLWEKKKRKEKKMTKLFLRKLRCLNVYVAAGAFNQDVMQHPSRLSPHAYGETVCMVLQKWDPDI